jgi:hypothetical protein
MSASPRKTLPAPCLNMISKNLILPAIPELKGCAPKLMAIWNSGRSVLSAALQNSLCEDRMGVVR